MLRRLFRRLLVLAALGAVTVGVWPYALRIPRVREAVEAAQGFWGFLIGPRELEYVTVGPTRVIRIQIPNPITVRIWRPVRDGIGDTVIRVTNSQTGEEKTARLPGRASDDEIKRVSDELERQLLGK